jgi:hypothetical protein
MMTTQTDLRVVEMTPVGLRLRHTRHGVQLWAMGKIRKVQTCVRCQIKYPVGSTMLHPLTNQKNREDRLCGDCARTMTRDALGR